MTPQVTCIIPVRNGAATIERAVKSAIDAGCHQVYVFDDASADATKKVVSQFLGYGTVGLSSSDFHVGVNYARNYLISRTSDDHLIICLDADDTLHDIAPLVAAWEPNTWVYGDHNQIDGTTSTRMKGAPAGGLARKNITGISFLFHRSDWQRVGGFDPDFGWCEDYGFQVALTNSGIRPKYIEHVVYDRYLKPEGNDRTIKAGLFWTFYRDLARMKYPAVFQGVG